MSKKLALEKPEFENKYLLFAQNVENYKRVRPDFDYDFAKNGFLNQDNQIKKGKNISISLQFFTLAILLLISSLGFLGFSHFNYQYNQCLQKLEPIKTEMSLNLEACNQGLLVQKTGKLEDLLSWNNLPVEAAAMDFEHRKTSWQNAKINVEEKQQINQLLNIEKTEPKSETKIELKQNSTDNPVDIKNMEKNIENSIENMFIAKNEPDNLLKSTEKLDNLNNQLQSQQWNYVQNLLDNIKKIDEKVAVSKDLKSKIIDAEIQKTEEELTLIKNQTDWLKNLSKEELNLDKSRATILLENKQKTQEIENNLNKKIDEEKQRIENEKRAKKPNSHVNVPKIFNTREEVQDVIINTIATEQKNHNPDCNLVKCIAMTFDDGPAPVLTGKVLQVLQSRRAKATFFVTGQNAQNYPDLIKQIFTEGHQIGNHTWNHPNLTKLGDNEILHQIKETNKVIEDIIQTKLEIFRPPYGAINENVIQIVNLPQIMWSIDTLDWKDRDSDLVAKRAIKNAKNGSIILLHDIHPSSVDAVAGILDTLIAQDYHFVTVSELLGSNGSNLSNQVYRHR